jgi:predicted Zn-dependent protease with MMP-like domain
MELESPYELLGLYRGTSLTEKSVGDVATDVDMVFLYRRPILDEWCETGERLGDLVRNVLIHEIGHHFGLSDAQMEAREAAADEGADEVPGEGPAEGTGDGG